MKKLLAFLVVSYSAVVRPCGVRGRAGTARPAAEVFSMLVPAAQKYNGLPR
jgi:hypothetical protein